MQRPLYTIGHSTHSLDGFLDLLARHGGLSPGLGFLDCEAEDALLAEIGSDSIRRAENQR